MEDGVLQVEQRPDVHRGYCHGASYGSELAHEGAEEPKRELPALVEQQMSIGSGGGDRGSSRVGPKPPCERCSPARRGTRASGLGLPRSCRGGHRSRGSAADRPRSACGELTRPCYGAIKMMLSMYTT